MTLNGTDAVASILWMDDEPKRLERDRREVEEFAPDLGFVEPRSQGFLHGGWRGRLPLWPFERPEPEGLGSLLATGLEVEVVFSAAHPMVPPAIYPVMPEPAIEERTQAMWHVAPDGSLCLLQSQGQWQPEASITELLLKAAGWHVEYALMKAEVIDKMTVCGIVGDDCLDGLVASATRQSDNMTGDEAEDTTSQSGNTA
ncbi:ubiquitin-conjugating enzyme E2 variant [Kribbella sp. NPDC055071]